MAARPVRFSRVSGSVLKLEWSQTPERTRGSANSRITAVTPPTNSETGFLNTRHDTESGAARAGSPAGAVKSMRGPPGIWVRFSMARDRAFMTPP
jgi:hypothetical protein